MDEIYTQFELEQIVGLKSSKKIVNWLTTNRIPYLLNAAGKPLVHRQALAFSMGAPVENKPINKPMELDFSNRKGFK